MEYKEVEGIDAKTYAGKAALAVKTKVRGVLGEDLLTLTLIDIVSFLMLNNKFASKGIIITDDNKEEAYIKIIETGDESLISDLERYLNLTEEMKVIEKKKTEYSTVIKNLQSLGNKDDVDAVNKIVEEYLRR
jgi:hypothetical protein